MMAATQPFLSGAISKTVNLPGEATMDNVAHLYMEGWKLGLKAVALPRRIESIATAIDVKHGRGSFRKTRRSFASRGRQGGP
jgi:ribonucleoside-diphosphate reductase alpha chain